jgi:hypothetical protein
MHLFTTALGPFLNAEALISQGSPLLELPVMEERKGRVSYVIGPDGSPLTLADLPPPSTRRWVIRRKAEVVAAVRGGLLSLDDACKRYTLTVEEFLAWQHAIDRFGLAGLRATRVQQYRN